MRKVYQNGKNLSTKSKNDYEFFKQLSGLVDGMIVAVQTTAVAVGSGYAANDVLGVDSGDGTGEVTVLSVTEGLKTVAINAAGTGYTDGTHVLTVAGGTGGTLTCTAAGGGIVSIDAITTIGDGYTIANAVATTGGGNNDFTVDVSALTLGVKAFKPAITTPGSAYYTGTFATTTVGGGSGCTVHIEANAPYTLAEHRRAALDELYLNLREAWPRWIKSNSALS